MVLAIRAPKATQVKAVHVATGTRVARGDLLLELQTFEEEKILSQIGRATEENQAKAIEVTGPVVVEKRAGLKSISEQRVVAVNAAILAYTASKERLAVGQDTTIDVTKARQDLALRSYRSLQSAIEYEIYSRNAEDAARVYRIVDGLLGKEKSYVEGSVARLRIEAPAAGIFRCFVFAGTPVRLGHLLAEID